MALSFLAPFAPLLWGLLACLFWWRQLSAPWLFLVVSVLALLGAQAVIHGLWSYLPLFVENQFLEAGKYVAARPISQGELERLAAEEGRTALIQETLVLVAAVPLLWWLKSGLAAK